MPSMRLSVTILALLVAVGGTRAEWTRTGNVPGNHIQCLVQSGGYLIAGSWGAGVYRSSDNGVTWTPANNGLFASSVYGLFSSSGWLFAGTESSGGVFRSSDNGGTWLLATTGIAPSTTVYGFASVDDSGRTNIFCAAYSAVYRSTDNGATWTVSRGGATAVRAMGSCGKQIFTGGTEGVYRTTNLGATWTRADSGMAYNYVSAFTSIGSTIYATIFGGGIYKSTNGGVYWTSAGLGTRNLWALGSTDTTVYAGENLGGVYRTTNGGTNWTTLGPASTTVQALAAAGSRVFAATNSGVVASTDRGTSWQPATISSPRTVSISGSSKLYTASFGGVSTSTDGGATWALSGLADWKVTSVAVSGSVAVAGAGGGGVFVSTDDGVTWTARNNGLASSTPNILFVVPSGTGGIKILNGTMYSGVYATSDTGKNWAASGNPGSTQMTAFASLGSVVLVGTTVTGVFRSTDNGGTWSQPVASTAAVLSLVTNSNRVYGGLNGSGVQVSTDTGKTWTASGLAGAIVRSMAATGTKIFAGGSTGVWLSMNNGASWQRVNTGLTDTMIYSLGITGTDLYAGVASGGIWKRALSELVVGVDAATPLVPGEFTLEQNYPNPFNGVSQIGFRIPEAAAVKLKVFDLLGREVAVLVNEHKPAGSYQVRFEAGNLSSGVYVYKLTAGSMALTRKLVLMK